jgi:acetyl esterase
MNSRLMLLLLLIFCGIQGALLAEETQLPPQVQHYRGKDGTLLELRITRPLASQAKLLPAILLFHGGGWSNGHAWWMDGPAARFAAEGMIGIAVQYRLASQQRGTTPIDSVDDALEAMRWVRRHAKQWGIDSSRIAAGGGSSGAHLAAILAMLDHDGETRPTALVLWSPAVSLTDSQWFIQLFGGIATANAYSPKLHVRRGLPPALLLQGGSDWVTSANSSEEYCRLMRESGNRCELKIYPGLGHMFTRQVDRQQQVDGYKDLDTGAEDDSYQRAFDFLRSLGLLD